MNTTVRRPAWLSGPIPPVVGDRPFGVCFVRVSVRGFGRLPRRRMRAVRAGGADVTSWLARGALRDRGTEHDASREDVASGRQRAVG
jgi:hypothetical protein